MKRCLIGLLMLTLALTGCVSDTHLPYRSWRLGFGAPVHMEVWVEDAQVLDVAGKHFGGLGVGVTSAPSDEGNPSGWPHNPGPGAGQDINGAALPKEIYVRWQSLVEPQAYQVVLHFTDAMRKQMLTQGPPPASSLKHPHPDWRYYNEVVVILAPGGWVKVWLGGVVEKAIPIMCVKARVNPVGPYGGKSNGKYRPLTKKTADYIATHPIPYDSWNCNAH